MKSNKAELIKFLNSVDFGLDVANDFYGGVNKFYMQDLKKFKTAQNEAVNLLQTLGRISDDELVEACKYAFSGRLEWNGSKFTYTPGQFYNIELPQAGLAVAEYIKSHRNN